MVCQTVYMCGGIFRLCVHVCGVVRLSVYMHVVVSDCVYKCVVVSSDCVQACGGVRLYVHMCVMVLSDTELKG